MEEFTLAEDSLPFDFFEEIGFSYQEIAIECIKNKFNTLTEADCEIIFENNYDDFSEKMYELRTSAAIFDYCVSEEEIDEGSGTWGYFHFEIDDVNIVKLKLEKEVRDLVEEVVNNLEL
jgi:hypothetical protein